VVGGAAQEQEAAAGKEGGSWASVAREPVSKGAPADVVHFIFAPDGQGEGVSYAALHERCTSAHVPKKSAEGGACRDLFAFWSYFLPSHFHAAMYAEFKALAQADAEASDGFGEARLFRFYRSRLEKAFELSLYNDFESTAVAAYERRGTKEGLQQLWNLHYFAQEKPTLGPSAATLLAEHFKPLDN
jgi:la-related protein 1